MSEEPKSIEDLLKQIDTLTTTFRETLGTEKERNQELREQNKILQEFTEKAKIHAEETEARISDLTETKRILEGLEDAGYQRVIKALFRKPSKEAARLTVLTALASIIFSILISLMLTRWSSVQSEKVIEIASIRLNLPSIKQLEKSNYPLKAK